MDRRVLATCAVEVEEDIHVAARALTSNVALEAELRLRGSSRSRNNMTFMHVSSQLLRLVLQLRLQIVKGKCLLLDGVVELYDLVSLLADCLAPFLGKRFEILDVCLGLFKLALEVVLGLLQ